MNKKTMISGVLGGVTYFLLGWLIWGVILKNSMSGMEGTATGVMRAESDFIWWALVVGNLFYGMALAYILGTWSGVTTFTGGAKAGALIALLFTAGYDFIYYATTNIMQLNGTIMDIAIQTVMGAIAGGVIGWWLGRPE
jgi:hypothetical protein